MANHDIVLGARNGVDISGPSLGLTMGWVLSHIPFASAFRESVPIPDDCACKLEGIASMFNDSVMGDYAHCFLHWTLAIAWRCTAMTHWTLAIG